MDGGVLGGLPSNTILGLSRTSASDVVHIATDGGVGQLIGAWTAGTRPSPP